MPNILYYSSYCENCQKLLAELAHVKHENTMFFSVDSRETINNVTYLILSNGSKVVLPPNVQQVPSLLMIDDNTKKHNLIVGSQIYEFFKINIKSTASNTSNANAQQEQLTKNGNPGMDEPIDDPAVFHMSGGPSSQVPSDTFSFLDTHADDLMASGNGGLQQLHNYSTLDYVHTISTPKEEYTPNTISNDGKSIDDIKKERDSQLQTINY